jgi:predicted membrane protein (TIGR00267 family)
MDLNARLYFEHTVLSWFRRLKEYLRVSEVASISRRYFVLNLFDGVMVMLGIILGAGTSNNVHPRFVIGTGMGAVFAMGVSGVAGAYMTERAERAGRLRRLRRAMLSDLKRSIHVDASHVAAVWTALVDGLAPLLGAGIPMVPYSLALFGVLSVTSAILLSIATILVVLFFLGMYLGRTSRESLLISGLRMMAVGVITALILAAVGAFTSG